MNNSELNNKFQEYIKQSNAVSITTSEKQGNEVINAAKLLFDCLAKGNKIMICGNGGSASDSSHLAAEFTNRFSIDIERDGLAAISLATDSAFITAHANDFNFDTIFSRQIESIGIKDDTLIAISTSGKSINVIKAIDKAKSMNINVISLTGNNTNLNKISDITINVQSENTQHIQETLLKIEHMLIYFVEQLIYKK